MVIQTCDNQCSSTDIRMSKLCGRCDGVVCMIKQRFIQISFYCLLGEKQLCACGRTQLNLHLDRTVVTEGAVPKQGCGTNSA
uniref:Uncharacterized protein n=1 Tax=Arundo donax TaxID=35708 RepID=A0A0A9BS96_ARUDO